MAGVVVANTMGELGPMFMSQSYAFEVQRTNNFEVVLQGFPPEFTLAVESSPSPVISNDPIELAYGNSKVKVAGQATFDDFDIQIKDFIDADMEMYLYDWRGQVYDPWTDRIGWAKDYKRNGFLHQYAPDGTCQRSWKLWGVWPTNFNGGDFQYDGGDKKLISMTLSVDKAVLCEREDSLGMHEVKRNRHDSSGRVVYSTAEAGSGDYASTRNNSGLPEGFYGGGMEGW